MRRNTLDNRELEELGRLGKKVHGVIENLQSYRKPGTYEPLQEDGKTGFGEAYPMKATEKFLGYYNAASHIAFNPSVSFTTDFSRVSSFCRYLKGEGRDRVFLNGVESGRYYRRASPALDIFRKTYGVDGHFQFRITIKRRYREAKGFSESAAIAGAVAKSLVSCMFESRATNDLEFASTLARLVSGSGTRAVFNGVSVWDSYAGIDERASCAHPLDIDHSRLRFVAIPARSSFRTDNAHSAVLSSQFYVDWVREKLEAVGTYLGGSPSIEDLLERGERDSFNLHSVLVSTGNVLFGTSTLKALENLKKFSDSNPGVHPLMDTGPSIVLCSTDESLLSEFVEFSGMKVIHGSLPVSVRAAPTKRESVQADEFFSNLGSAK